METVEIECETIGITKDAIMIENIKGQNVWIPKSQISDYCSDSNLEMDSPDFSPTSIFIPEWLASGKDLI